MNSLGANFAEPALLQGRAAGVGQPFTKGRDQRLAARDQGSVPMSSFYALALELMSRNARSEITASFFQPPTSSL